MFEVSLWLLEREKVESIKFFVQYVKTPEMVKFMPLGRWQGMLTPAEKVSIVMDTVDIFFFCLEIFR